MRMQVEGLFDQSPQLGLAPPTRQPSGMVPLDAPAQGQVPELGAPAAPAAPGGQVSGLFPKGAGSGAAAGLASAGSMGPSYDAKSAAVNVGTATLSGAVAGGLYGGPAGALAGGLLAAASSGVNAWMQVGAENKRQAETAALIREVEEKKAALDKRDRADQLGQLKYDRKEAAFQKAWGVAQSQKDAITSLINQNTTLRQRYIQSGVKKEYA